jgi:transposase-like protein
MKNTCIFCKSKNVVAILPTDSSYLCQTCFNAWRDGQEHPIEEFFDAKPN